MDALTVKNVSKIYSEHKALDNVSLTIPEKTIFGLLGPNGAGKTTLIRIINQIINADSGEVLVFGEKVYNLKNGKLNVSEIRKREEQRVIHEYHKCTVAD